MYLTQFCGVYYIIECLDVIAVFTKRITKAASYEPAYLRSCSCNVGVKYSATRRVSTAVSILATPVASAPVAQFMETRSLTVM